MKKRILTAKEQFDMLSPWMITAAPPAFDKVYDDDDNFLRRERPQDFPALSPKPEVEELAEPPKVRMPNFQTYELSDGTVVKQHNNPTQQTLFPQNESLTSGIPWVSEAPDPGRFKKVKPGPQELPEGWEAIEVGDGKKKTEITVSPEGNRYRTIDGDTVQVGEDGKPLPTPEGERPPPSGYQSALSPEEESKGGAPIDPDNEWDSRNPNGQGFHENLARFLLPEELERSLIDKYNAADMGTREAGGQWYDTANEYIHNLAQKSGLDPAKVGAIVSAFSPQTSWDANMAAANYFIMNYDPDNPDAINDKMGGLGDNLERAKRIHAADNEEGYLAGLQNGNDAHKITNFYHNLMGSKNHVTIDSWMARALLGKGADGLADKSVQKVLNWKGGYDTMADAVRSAAQKLGVSPRELQAIVWSQVVPTAGSYEELSPEQYAKQKKQRENYIDKAPENAKLLPDYFHGPAWESRPEPTYRNKVSPNAAKPRWGKRFWQANNEDSTENADPSTYKHFTKPHFPFPEEKFRMITRERNENGGLGDFKDTSRTYQDRKGEEHKYYSPHEINPITKSPMTDEPFPFPFEWDGKGWTRTQDHEERGRPKKWEQLDPQRERFHDPNSKLIPSRNQPDFESVAPERNQHYNPGNFWEGDGYHEPAHQYTPIYRGTYVNVDDFLGGIPSRTPEMGSNDVSATGSGGPKAEQLALDFPVERDVHNRSRDSIWDHPDLGRMLLDHMSMPKDPVRGGGMGRHYTTSSDIAQGLVPPVPDHLYDENSFVPVVTESMWHGRGENPDMPGVGYNLDENGQKKPWLEDEVNLIPGAQIYPRRVWTIPPGEKEWRQVLSEPYIQREAGIQDDKYPQHWMDKAEQLARDTGGFTIHDDPSIPGDAPSSGYQVAIPGYERTDINTGQGWADFAHEINPVLRGENTGLGTWRNEEDGLYYTEPSERFHDYDEGARATLDRNQWAMWDNGAFTVDPQTGEKNFLDQATIPRTDIAQQGIANSTGFTLAKNRGITYRPTALKCAKRFWEG